MRQLKHANLIKLYGVIELNGHPAIVLEYAQCGSLADVLHNCDISLSLELRSTCVGRCKWNGLLAFASTSRAASRLEIA